MRPLPGPRLAAVQRATASPSSQVLTRRGSIRQTDPDYLLAYQDWQASARRFSRTSGVVRFVAGMKSDVCARCNLVVEERDALGDWNETALPELRGITDEYRNTMLGQSSRELIRMHAWHYSVAGECIQTMMDAPDGQGVDWGVYSTATVDWDKPQQGFALIKLTPDGKLPDTAFTLPRDQVTRFWIPDEEYPAYATSPLAASIEDLQRYRSFARYAKATAESQLAMSGIVWMPGEAFMEPGNMDDVGDEDVGTPVAKLEQQYYEAARLRFDETSDIAAIAPMLLHWDHDLGEPKSVQVGRGLDPQGIAYRDEALHDFARGSDLPASIVVGGGPGDANHWTEWLVDEKFFDSAIAPTMDRITHEDITATFLRPRVRLAGLDPSRFRIGYDPAPVLVHPDTSDKALRLLSVGALSYASTLEACGFNPDDQMTDPQDREWLLEVLSRGAAGEQQAPATPGTTVQTPPSAGNGVTPVSAGVQPVPFDGTVRTAALTRADARQLLARLQRHRANLGKSLISAAELAVQEALRLAGVKVRTRARGRASNGKREQVEEALESGALLAPLMQQVGVTESDVLRNAFDSFQAQAQSHFDRYEKATTRLLDNRELGGTGRRVDSAAAIGFLTAGMVAVLRQQITGRVPATVFPSPFVVPPKPVSVGRVPARMILDAIRVGEGRSRAIFAEIADLAPEARPIAGVSTLEEEVSRFLADGDLATYVWRHGFYGDPDQPFEPHESLDGYTTTEPETDPLLAIGGTFPEGAYYQPGDHDGCTCEWEVVAPSG